MLLKEVTRLLIKWYPRSWIQIKTEELVIYIDPSYLSSYYGKYSKKIIFSEAEDDCLPENLEKADFILISHVHKDHCKEVTINRLSSQETLVFTPKKYKKEEDDKVRLVKAGSRYDYKNASIEIIDAYNTPEGSSTKKVHKKGECVGYILDLTGKRIYFSGDTDFIPEMGELGGIDIAIIPIGGVFTMDMDEAIEAVLAIKPKHVIPVHHLKASPAAFKTELNKKSDTNVILLDIGGECEIL